MMGAWRTIPKMGIARAGMSFLAFILLCFFFSLRNVRNLELDHSDLHNIPAHLRGMQIVMPTSKEVTSELHRDEAQNEKEYGDHGNMVLSDDAEALKKLLSGSNRLLLHQLINPAKEKENLMQPDQPVPFILVTGERSSPCITSRGSNVMMKTYKNKVDYCNLHGCNVWYALEVWQKGFVGTWVRYPLLLRLMKANPSVTWFMWMDSDAIFTDFNFSIPFHTYNGWNKNLVVPGFWEKVYGEDPDWMGLNAGIFLIRNCEWSHRFLEKWMELGAPENLEAAKKALNTVLKNRPHEWDPDDQSALVYLLNKNKTKSEEKVFLEASYILHGYFQYIIDKFEEILEGKDKWPFVTHFSGCNFCGNEDITDRCSHGFDRAFNFADNQLLSLVALRHSSLMSASTLEPTS